MSRLDRLATEFVEFMPREKRDGVLYVSERFRLAICNCPCGCGHQCVMPLGREGWEMSRKDGTTTLSPSIRNSGCGAHWLLVADGVSWCE